ncbi:superoxide dismutase [Nocardioides sp.]|uniref:SMP-30/gluconolactonase/LRE family protein n=1 Tax=Nocardioides sp. TaxID=35761 RepID=UPI0032197535
MTTLGTTLGRHRSPAALLAAAALGAALLAPGATASAAPSQAPAGPDGDRTIALPDGFQPEGIAIRKRTAYAGSLADGDIYAFDVRTGEGDVISEGPGTASVGLDVHRRTGRLYVSGGDAGTARVVDTDTGEVVADYTLTEGPAFINDVIVTPRAAWFTNSAAPEIYRVPITKKGRPAPQRKVRTIALSGEWAQPDGFGANGITRSPDGKALLVVNSTDGTLFRVPTKGKVAGFAVEADLGGQSLTNGDGMLLQGRRLYVVRNRLDKVVKLKLDKRGTSGERVATIRSTTFDVPTTIAAKRGRLLLPNARFGTEPQADTAYTVSVVGKK